MTDALEIEGLVSGYGDSMVLRNLALTVRPGEVMAVLGKNGMGKSTLLKTIMGFLPPRSGRIAVFGQDATALPPHRMRDRAVAYSPQDQAIFQDLTVEENLRLGLPRGASLPREVERVAGYFPFLGKRQRQKAGTLSGGEQKMLIMARALVARPKLMLVDEITEGLQPSVILLLAGVLRAQREQGTAILLIEQNVRFALGLADRYAVLTQGEIVDQGEAASPEAETSIHDHLAV